MTGELRELSRTTARKTKGERREGEKGRGILSNQRLFVFDSDAFKNDIAERSD